MLAVIAIVYLIFDILFRSPDQPREIMNEARGVVDAVWPVLAQTWQDGHEAGEDQHYGHDRDNPYQS